MFSSRFRRWTTGFAGGQDARSPTVIPSGRDCRRSNGSRPSPKARSILPRNVRLSELGVLAQAAAASPPGSEIIEIGTFDGRTTINLAMNAPEGSAVFTLDLPPDHPTQFQLAPGERMFVDKALPGQRFRNGRRRWPVKVAGIM